MLLCKAGGKRLDFFLPNVYLGRNVVLGLENYNLQSLFHLKCLVSIYLEKNMKILNNLSICCDGTQLNH